MKIERNDVEMEKRIFMATKKELTVGVVYMPNEMGANNKIGKASRIPTIEYKHEGIMKGFADTRLSSLTALMKVIRDTCKEEEDGIAGGNENARLTNIVQIFVNRQLFEFINGELYKYWILTGKKSTGDEVSEHELNKLREFVALWKEKGDKFVIKDIFNCRINDTVKADPKRLAQFKPYTQQNDFYCRWCWDEIAKLYNESVQDSMASVV